MKIRKRILILVMLVTVLPLLIGAGKKTVELLDDKKKLIDLDLAIVEGEFGNGGTEETTEQESLEEEENIVPSNNSDNEPDTKSAKRIVITIHFEEIKYNGVICSDVSAVRGYILSSYNDGDSIILNDDYAESHVYIEVLDLLKELNDTKGFKYVEQ